MRVRAAAKWTAVAIIAVPVVYLLVLASLSAFYTPTAESVGAGAACVPTQADAPADPALVAPIDPVADAPRNRSTEE